MVPALKIVVLGRRKLNDRKTKLSETNRETKHNSAQSKRCSWVNADDPLLLQYHDREWGVPAHSDRKHFEVLILSGVQAGLNWSLVLKKREGYRRAFDKFDPEKVARYSERQIQKLLSDPEIIRNRMKIEAAVRNAGAFLKVQEEFGNFDSYCWRFVDGRPKLNRWKTARQIPARHRGGHLSDIAHLAGQVGCHGVDRVG